MLSDLHLRRGGKTIIGLDPVARCRAVLDQVVADHPDAKALILMGDLTHAGLTEEYAVLHNLLAGCPIPLAYMIGNHDNRDTFRAAFAQAEVTLHGHVQRIIDLPLHRIITLDTHDPNPDPHHAGSLCVDRLAWLDTALATRGGRILWQLSALPPLSWAYSGGTSEKGGMLRIFRLRGAA